MLNDYVRAAIDRLLSYAGAAPGQLAAIAQSEIGQLVDLARETRSAITIELGLIESEHAAGLLYGDERLLWQTGSQLGEIQAALEAEMERRRVTQFSGPAGGST